jgi:methionine adenosyltransferase
LQRGLKPVAQFCVTLQAQIDLVCPQTTVVGSAGRMCIYNINRYTNNKIMAYLFSSESVSEGHPDKVSDQISDALVDQFLAYDDEAHCAIETFVTTGQVVIMGEVRSDSYIDLQTIARNTINRIGYTKSEYQFDGNSCGVLTAIHEQSDDINRGVSREEEEEQGAGDQGMMFGYATNETENYMPLSLDLAHLLMITLAEIRKEGKEMTYLRPDSKSQVTVEYSDDGQPVRIDTIVVSTQHDDFGPDDDQMLAKIKADVLSVLMPRVKAQITSPKVLALFNDDIKYFVNPTGKFVIGGPHGDTGLTGRKIIVDTYGGKGAHGGGAFSGKDPSKVDRSAAYAARHIAKNMVAAGVADEMQVQVSYAIGVAKPVNIYVNTYGRSKVKFTDGEIAQKVAELFDLRPKAIERTLKLRQPIYTETAAYGHMGRKNEVVKKTFTSRYHETKVMEVELFTWEKLDRVDDIKKAFGL